MEAAGFFSRSHEGTPWAGLKNPAVRITFTGNLSETGQYGHLAIYHREVVVREVLAMSAVEGCE
jgi:hypothetical protein